MYDISITFGSEGIVFDFDTLISDIDATAQEVLINTSTTLGEDRFFPARGTDLFKNAAQFGILNLNRATHEANFASTNTTLFIQSTNADDPHLVQEYQLQPLSITDGRLQLNALITTINGDTIGIDKTLNNNGN